MNLKPTGAPLQAPHPARDAASGAEEMLAALRFVARHYGVSLSDQSARLAGQWDNSADPDQRIRTMARRLGLRTAFSDPRDFRMSSLHLPLILEMDDGAVAVMTAIAGEEAVIAPAGTPAAERRMQLSELTARVHRIVHARTATQLADERIDSYVRPYEPHWLRRILMKDARSYGNVLLASLVANSLALAGIIFSMQVYDRVIPAESIPTLVVLFIGVMFALLLGFVLHRMRLAIIDLLGKRADRRLSDLVFGHALRVKSATRPPSTGAFIAQVRDLEQVRETLGSTTVTAIADIPFFFLFATVFWFLAGSLVLVPIGALILFVVPGILVQRRLRAYATEAMRESSLRNGMLVEAVQGIEDIKTLQAEEHFQRRWNHYTAAAAEAQLKMRGLANSLTAWTQTVQMAVYAATVLVGAPMVIAGDITTGVLVGASVMGSRMLAPMAHLTQVFSRLQQARVGAQSLNRIMALPVDHPEGESRISLPSTKGELAARHAQFRYGEDEAPVVLSVDGLAIGAGERVAVLGRNGAGKSTLLQGLSGLLQPCAGEVLIDGLNLAHVDPADVRREIGLLSNNSRLFHGTIRENLMLGAPLASDREILAALEIVRAGQFIRSLHRGMEYRIREGGAGLSGGQVQALLLVRLLLRDPTVLLLDEPTAAMDEATERHFVEQFGRWSQGRTVVIATHRTRILDLVDRVVVVENGRLVCDQSKARFLAERAAVRDASNGEQIRGRRR